MSRQKIALITGANKGIGYETARQLGQTGVKILLGARDEKRGRAAEVKLKAEGVDARFVLLDVDNMETHEAVKKLIEKEYGVLDILINNAGVNLEGDNVKAASQTTLEIYRRTFDTNLFSLIALTQTLLPLIKKSDAGRIVNLSSILASLALHSASDSPIYNFKVPAYDISKTALNAFTVHLAYELKDTKIKVNAAHPGWVKTDMGGSGATMEIEDGAKTSVQLATLPDDAPSGRYVHLGAELPW